MQLAALMADEVDLLLAHDPPSSDWLNVIETVPQPLCAMMRPEHPLAARPSIRLAECQPYPVALGTEVFASRRLIKSVMIKSRLSLKIAMESSASQPQKIFAARGDGICFQYRIGSLRDVRNGVLVAIPLTDPDLTSGRLVLASRAGRLLPIPAAGFVETLKAVFGGIPDDAGTPSVPPGAK
jgi:DNA-binding transcriptional LysR family regulator